MCNFIFEGKCKIKNAFKAVFFFLTEHLFKEIIFQVFGGILMGCINGKSPLTEEDMNYIARNTAMEKDAVEVILDDNRDEKGLSPRERRYLGEFSNYLAPY